MTSVTGSSKSLSSWQLAWMPLSCACVSVYVWVCMCVYVSHSNFCKVKGRALREKWGVKVGSRYWNTQADVLVLEG